MCVEYVSITPAWHTPNSLLEMSSRRSKLDQVPAAAAAFPPVCSLHACRAIFSSKGSLATFGPEELCLSSQPKESCKGRHALHVAGRGQRRGCGRVCHKHQALLEACQLLDLHRRG